MISHVVVLSGFLIDRIKLDRSKQFSFDFNIDQTYILLITTNQLHFLHTPHLYNQPRCFPIQFSSQSTLNQIGHDSLEFFSTQTALVRSVTSLTYMDFVTDPTRLDQSFLTQTASIQSVTQLFYLVFFIVSTRSNWSRQLNLVFDIDRIFRINHVVILDGFRYNWHPI